MISRITRPITEQESKIISSVQQHPILNAIGFGFFCALTIAVVLMLFWFLLSLLFPYLKQFKFNTEIFFIIGVPFGIYQVCKTHFKMKKLSRRNKSLQKEFVEELTIDVFQAIKVEEFEDEGIGYYLDVAEGKVLFIQGQYLYDEDENGKPEMKIPSTRMKFIRVVGSGLLLDFTCLGNYLSPSHVNPPFTTQDFERDRVHYDGDIFEADFESLKLSR